MGVFCRTVVGNSQNLCMSASDMTQTQVFVISFYGSVMLIKETLKNPRNFHDTLISSIYGMSFGVDITSYVKVSDFPVLSMEYKIQFHVSVYINML